ncbi:MAG: c-type cytochrome [Chitinophagaceae bacterium]|nr:c-type cytochrome [Chitinophagaceae bacterium]
MKKIVYSSWLLLLVFSCKKDPQVILPGQTTPYNLTIPSSLPKLVIPSENPLTVEGVALGRKLFYDNILSANNTMSCASCHQFKNYFVDSNKAFSVGIDNIAGTRNSMPLFNMGYAKNYFWDGGATSLEAQVSGPITNKIELHETLENVVSKLQAHPQYPDLFKKAFGSDRITTKHLFYAIAQFERTLISGNSKFDQWRKGLVQLTDAETRGMNLYNDENKGDCVHCHTFGSTFTDFEFRNTGLDSIPVDKGRGLITLNSADDGKFKTPSLRNIAVTAPYMHDGRFLTLQSCVEHYNKNFHYTANLAPELKSKLKNRLSEQDVQDIVAFLNTLTDAEFITKSEFDRP